MNELQNSKTTAFCASCGRKGKPEDCWCLKCGEFFVKVDLTLPKNSKPVTKFERAKIEVEKAVEEKKIAPMQNVIDNAIWEAIKYFKGNKTLAARALKISLRTVRNRSNRTIPYKRGL